MILIESSNIFKLKREKNQSGCGVRSKFGSNYVQCCKKVKKQELSMGCFYTLYEEHLLNQKVLVLQTPEWKFKANIARNATFEGH